MAVTYTELFFKQGTTFSHDIRVANTITHSNVNVTSMTVKSQLRRSWQANTETANIVCTITDGSNGIINLSLPAANTANIKHGRYFFDVETTDANGVVSVIMDGIIHIEPNYTRD